MAPRSTKTKKATDVKVADEAPKGKGKGKIIEEPVIEAKAELEENIEDVAVPDKKAKRGKKKAINDKNGLKPVDDKAEDVAPPAKKSKKKKAEESDPDDVSNDGDEADKNGDIEANGDSEEAEKAPAGRGRGKQAKKEPTVVKAGRGKKAKPGKANGDVEKEAVAEKPSAKRRGRKPQSKDDASNEEEVKSEPVAKGRKKVTKEVKEKTPESEEEKVVEEPKKKEAKGRKGRGKKPKEEVPQDKEEDEQTEEKGNGDAKAVEETDEVEEEIKPAKGKRAPKKRSAETPAVDDESQDMQDTGEPKKKKRALSEDTKTAPPKNKASTDYDSLDFSNSSKNKQDKEWNFKIASWNVDGIRAWLNKGGLDYIKYEKPDILCLQETKCAQEKLPDDVANLPGYHSYWVGSEKDGYAGVGIYTTKLAMNVQYGLQDEELDSEGRIITAEYEHFYLICTYVPNAGRNLVTLPKRLKWNEEFRKFVKDLDKKKPVIICGDMNVSHEEIDLANPKTNKKNAGFTIEERTGMSDLLGDGFVDTFRHLNPDKTGAYTFWTYMKNSRSKNVGWRLDYFIVSERLLPSLCDSIIRDQVYGSDHCPITLFLHLSSADKPK
ncbi:DNA-(apurinic or apyrimidinic site) endonuclease [Amyelois transitella]|uniref:DNA-(apurinic or apyrimidinic site) endonuclease n=1 Tax=Amyelois transitella TaxID=680683 RepID=UPI00298F9E53|nr:DNA-(apurinic or apyrimidinic site) endonuclease [Amyelois transitella]